MTDGAGEGAPAPGTFFVLTALEHVHYERCVRFRMCRRHVERMREEKWSLMICRADTGMQSECAARERSFTRVLMSVMSAVTEPVPIQKWPLLNEHAS